MCDRLTDLWISAMQNPALTLMAARDAAHQALAAYEARA